MLNTVYAHAGHWRLFEQLMEKGFYIYADFEKNTEKNIGYSSVSVAFFAGQIYIFCD